MRLALKAFGSAECLKHCWNCVERETGMIQNYSMRKNEVFSLSFLGFFGHYDDSNNW